MIEALPVNIDAERLVLGALLSGAADVADVRGSLSEGDFSLDKHKRILRRAYAVYDGGGAVDRLTVATALMDAGELAAVDGLSYLVSLDDGIPSTIDLGQWVRLLKDDAARRRIIEIGQSLISRASNRDSPQSIMDSMTTAAIELAPTGSKTGLVSSAEVIDREGLGKILAPRRERGMPFPWEWMTNATCGLLPGELWILAAHTSAGKTSAALQTGVHVAKHGTPVAMFSLEMGDVSLVQRAIWQLSRVDSGKAKRGLLTPEERTKATEAGNLIYSLPLYFDDSARSVIDIHAALRRRRLSGGLIIVDYLQLLGDAGRYESRAQAVGANARALKLMATEFGAAVLLLSQFNRDSAKPDKQSGAKRKPELFDLKESGDIENHANGVWFIHRPSQTDADCVPVEFILAKQRDGRRDIFAQFQFWTRFQSFSQATEQREEAA